MYRFLGRCDQSCLPLNELALLTRCSVAFHYELTHIIILTKFCVCNLNIIYLQLLKVKEVPEKHRIGKLFYGKKIRWGGGGGVQMTLSPLYYFVTINSLVVRGLTSKDNKTIFDMIIF